MDKNSALDTYRGLLYPEDLPFIESNSYID